MYEAISYSWNEDRNPEIVFMQLKHATSDVVKDAPECDLFVNGMDIRISQCVFKGLCTLKRALKSDNPPYLWLDVLCINQTDSTEKSAQVSVMDSIYADAKETHVWLGEALEFLDRPLQIIEDIGNSAFIESIWNTERYQLLCQRIKEDWRLELFQDKSFLHETGFVPMTQDDWYGIKLFFSREWFARSWTFQEIVLTPFARFWYGQRSIVPGALLRFSQFLVDSNLHHWLSKLRTRSQPRMVGHYPVPGQNLVDIQHIRLACRGEFDPVFSLAEAWSQRVDSSKSLLSFLWKLTGNRKASDDRDVVYSLLGMVNCIANKMGFDPIGIAPDYTLPPEEVEIAVMRMMLESEPCLRPLSLISAVSVKRVERRPTWANLNERCERSLLCNWATWMRSARFCAPPDVASMPGASFSVVGCRLRVKACLIAPVKHVLDNQLSSIDLQTFLDAVLSHIQESVETYGSIDDALDAYLSVILASGNPAEEGLPRSRRSFYVVLYRAIVIKYSKQADRDHPSVESFSKSLDDDPFLASLFIHINNKVHDWIESDRPAQEMSPFLQVVGGMVRRRLFRTASTVGTGPDTMEIGDTLWIIRGGDKVYALRKAEHGSASNTYYFVGDAFLDTISKEAIPNLEEARWQDLAII